MEGIKNLLQDNPYISVAVIAASTYVVYRLLFGGPKKLKIQNPPNTVVLYQIPRGPYAPNMSPFPVKLETYLRMAKIPYINNFSLLNMSSKGKTPWISYNGEPVADSQFSIEYLNKKFHVDLDKNLTKEQRAVARAIQIMVDEHLYWTLGYFRFLGNTSKEMLRVATCRPLPIIVHKLWFAYMREKFRGVLYGQGIGRHTNQEIRHIMMTDLQALADYLGDKPFIMGDVPCETDCAVFGMLSQFEWQMEGVVANILQDNFPNLHQYCLRMKDKFWPDWNECITHGGTKKATK